MYMLPALVGQDTSSGPFWSNMASVEGHSGLWGEVHVPGIAGAFARHYHRVHA